MIRTMEALIAARSRLAVSQRAVARLTNNSLPPAHLDRSEHHVSLWSVSNCVVSIEHNRSKPTSNSQVDLPVGRNCTLFKCAAASPFTTMHSFHLGGKLFQQHCISRE